MSARPASRRITTAMRFMLPFHLAVAIGCSTEHGARAARIQIPAPALAGSVIPNAAMQPALVLLPPGYDAGTERYPVLYYLPGFTNDVDEYIGRSFDRFDFARALQRVA